MSERTFQNLELPFWEKDSRIEFIIWAYEGGTPIISDDVHKGDNVVVIKKEELSDRIKANIFAFFVVDSHDPVILSHFESIKCDYITFAGSMVQPSMLYYREGYGKVGLLFNKFKAFTKRSIKDNIILIKSKIIQKKGDIKEINHPKALIVPTKYATESTLNTRQKGENILYVHRFDYDRYLRVNRNNNKQLDKHIVFVDSAMADLHPDWVRLGYESNVRKHRDAYYNQLERFFTVLEKHYGVPVIIAGHPGAEYDEKSYCGREIVIGNTCDLIREAKAVIFDISSAINYALLYDKEIVYHYNDDYTDMIYGIADMGSGYIRHVAEDILGLCALNLSDEKSFDAPWNYIRKVDDQAREDYISKYIIDSDVTNLTTSEFLIERIISDNWEP